MTEQQTTTENWLQSEIEELEQQLGPQYPALKLETGKITEFTVNFAEKPKEWQDIETGAIKKILAVTHKGERKNLWIKVKNPLYRQLIQAGIAANGQAVTFKVSTTGTMADTRYTIVTED